MAIAAADLETFKHKILEAKRPLFFHDDDADGLCSYLQCLHARGDGVGIRAKHAVHADALRKVDENQPDLIVILDCAYVEPEFLHGVSVPVLWLDHHEVQTNIPPNVHYYNPRKADDLDNRCTTYWVYQAFKREEDLWIAAIGTVSDWQVTEVAQAFWEKYPSILPPIQTAPQGLFGEHKFAELTRIIQFNLKGDSTDVRTAIKILSRIESPFELLEHKTPRSKLLHKRFLLVEKEYEKLLREAQGAATPSGLLYYLYPNVEISLLSEVSNKLTFLFPDKLIFIAREHGGEHKFSLRGENYNIAAGVKVAMATGVRGNAGGHTHACGGNINSEDFPKFFEAFKHYFNF